MTALALASSERLSVLVVEDNPADADLVRDLLRGADLVARGAVAPEIHHVETLRGALAAAKQHFDVALLDLGLPDASGLEGLSALSAAVPELPAVVLTGTRDPSLAARALIAGAEDFLVKGEIEGELLLRSLRFAVARHRRAARQRASAGAAPDGMTASRAIASRSSDEPARRRILLVEDNPGDADLVRLALEGYAAFEVHHVVRLSDALTHLSRADVDAVLLDLALPDATGIECIEKVRTAAPDLPVVVLTGSSIAGLEALRSGVQDFATKGELDPEHLQRAINYAIERAAHSLRARELSAERAAHEATAAAAKALEALHQREAAARAEAERRRQEVEELVMALRETDERKNQFLAMLSHELRNPLAPIRNSVYVLERAAPGGDQARRACAVIDRQVHHLTRLVDDLLDVTRISHGKFQLELERVDLAGIARQVAEDHRSTFASNGVELETMTDASRMWMRGDSTRIAQLIGNLLHNAAKFTPRGGRATLSVERETDDRARIRVHDSGEGIAPSALSDIFSPFVQADRSLDRKHGGLGLGLALVKGIAELHGGTATVRSDGVGKGAEFTVTLPLEDSAELHAVMTSVTAVPRRVLVIEDNLDAAESLKDVLELREHVVEIAASGPEGLEKARAFRPDVVLCDIGLPAMDGFEVASALRSDPTLRDTALVALSGYAAPADVERAIEAGFDRHLAKPVGLDQLERVMSEVAALRHEPSGRRD